MYLYLACGRFRACPEGQLMSTQRNSKDLVPQRHQSVAALLLPSPAKEVAGTSGTCQGSSASKSWSIVPQVAVQKASDLWMLFEPNTNGKRIGKVGKACTMMQPGNRESGNTTLSISRQKCWQHLNILEPSEQPCSFDELTLKTISQSQHSMVKVLRFAKLVTVLVDLVIDSDKTQQLFLPGLLRGFALPHCPHLRAGKGIQVNVKWNDKVKWKEECWVIQNVWDTVVSCCAYTQTHSNSAAARWERCKFMRCSGS